MSGQISPAALLPALPAVLMGIILFLTARKLRIEREQSEAGPLPENPSDKDGGNRLAGALRRVCQGAAPQLSTTEAAQLWAVIAFAPSVFILAMGSTAGAVAALPLGIAAFPIWVKSKRGAEQGLFEEQLGQAMPLIASNLRTGASIAQSVAPVAEHMDEPLKSEFAILERDLRNGRPIDQALDDMAKMNEELQPQALFNGRIGIAADRRLAFRDHGACRRGHPGKGQGEALGRGQDLLGTVRGKDRRLRADRHAAAHVGCLGNAPAVLHDAFGVGVPGRGHSARYHRFHGAEANKQHQVRLGELRCSNQ